MRKLLGIIAILILLLCSCTTTKYVEVPVKTVQTEYIHNTRTDSVVIRDSIDRWLNGDTLYIYKERTKYLTRERVDTICRTDTITNVVTIESVKEVKVKQPLKWYQEALMWVGGVMLITLILYTLIKIKFK